MKRQQAFKFELKPTGDQQRDIRRYAGACRFVFNKALALQIENHVAGEKFIGYVVMAKHLTAWRNDGETPWLKEAPVTDRIVPTVALATHAALKAMARQ